MVGLKGNVKFVMGLCSSNPEGLDFCFLRLGDPGLVAELNQESPGCVYLTSESWIRKAAWVVPAASGLYLPKNII